MIILIPRARGSSWRSTPEWGVEWTSQGLSWRPIDIVAIETDLPWEWSVKLKIKKSQR